ncbi:leucine--tRNA ligase [Alphaproteobacteria bacterium]|nr:leucine--tRNA ligase [Alphaproteobacteria bacterium]GHS96830.1 leucine--tRNA ligase [Alphaproteobacteria bacterium]
MQGFGLLPFVEVKQDKKGLFSLKGNNGTLSQFFRILPSAMAKNYPFRSVEEKWQKIWSTKAAHKTPTLSGEDSAKKCYVLEMLPYPSGKIHMGHVRNYCIGDVLARFKKATGHKVLHPMGWDAFGMPAENAAMQNGTAPKTWTYQNIEAMKATLLALGVSYDWERELATCSEDYYGHEQQLFLEMYEKGLVYRNESWVNWDPVDNTVLANEQVIDGKGWRSGALVVRKKLPHWCLRITHYVEELLANLDTLGATHEKAGWPEKVLTMQRHWIGKSEGGLIQFGFSEDSADRLKDYKDPSLVVFSTRPETLFGASFCALAPTHPLIEFLAQADASLAQFVQKCHEAPTTESTLSVAEKQGYDTGIRVKNPVKPTETFPVYAANFVLMEYGTGAIFGCPAHDERDFDFAKKYHLPIVSVIRPENSAEAVLPYVETNGIMENSEFLTGLTVLEARKNVLDALEKKGDALRKTTYRLRDWSVSRQRYWGCPIPMIHCPKCGTQPVPKADLPVLLPEDVDFQKSGNPLDHHPTWKNVTCPQCGGEAHRETDTLDTFFESSWYFLRYCCPKATTPLDRDAVAQWMPVDLYIGGVEHAVLHLLYARFFNMVLCDLGYLEAREPFSVLLSQGMVCHTSFQDEKGQWVYPDDVESLANGRLVKKADQTPIRAMRAEKMSKSKKNIIDPERMMDTYGVDALRIFIMSDTPYEKDFDWNTDALEGSWRYLNKMWRLCEGVRDDYTFSEDLLAFSLKKTLTQEEAPLLLKTAHRYLKKITQALDQFAFHKALAFHRELTREIENNVGKEAHACDEAFLAEILHIWCEALAPFAPHFALEVYATLFEPKDACVELKWPVLREDLAYSETVTIAVQVNGKLRETFEIERDAEDAVLQTEGLKLEKIQKFIQGKKIKKIFIVRNKLLNIVVEDR